MLAQNTLIELDLHFVQEKVIKDELSVQHEPSAERLVDGLTNPSAQDAYSQFCSKLSVSSLRAAFELEGGC